MKRFCKIAMALVLALTAMTVMAFSAVADGTVTYDGTAQKFIFAKGSDYSPTDLFDGFKNVMPGDKLTQKVTIDNKISNDVKIRVFMRSTGAVSGSEDFLSQLKLKVVQDGNSNLFEAPADQTASLKDWVYLGTVYSGGKIDLDLTLEVPATLGNEYQNAVGHLDWQFKVDELPIEKDDPAPKMGENITPLMWTVCGAMLVLLLAVIAMIIRKKQSAR